MIDVLEESIKNLQSDEEPRIRMRGISQQEIRKEFGHNLDIETLRKGSKGKLETAISYSVYYFAKIIDAIFGFIFGTLTLCACCLRWESLRDQGGEFFARLWRNDPNPEHEVDVKTINISWIPNHNRDLKHFCKALSNMKNPDVKACDLVSIIVSTLWEQNWTFVLTKVLFPNLAYSLLMIFYMCVYMERPVGDEVLPDQAVVLFFIVVFWAYLVYDETLQRFS